jgi:carbon-monoxide dehydrogenase small subunit
LKVKKRLIELVVNGDRYEVAVPCHWTLLELLREELGLIGTKEACNIGECGSCTVLMNGKAVLSCLILAVEAQGEEITTIEGLRSREGKLHPLQESFQRHGAVQCGFCTPGMILASKSLLDENPGPTMTEIKETLRGHYCRCTGYKKIVEAVQSAAATAKRGG